VIDPAGNQWQFSYCPSCGALSGVLGPPGTPIIAYAYDALGHRVSETIPTWGATIFYIFDGDLLIGEMTVSPGQSSSAEPESEDRTAWLHDDGLSSALPRPIAKKESPARASSILFPSLASLAEASEPTEAEAASDDDEYVGVQGAYAGTPIPPIVGSALRQSAGANRMGRSATPTTPPVKFWAGGFPMPQMGSSTPPGPQALLNNKKAMDAGSPTTQTAVTAVYTWGAAGLVSENISWLASTGNPGSLFYAYYPNGATLALTDINGVGGIANPSQPASLNFFENILRQTPVKWPPNHHLYMEEKQAGPPPRNRAISPRPKRLSANFRDAV
jgi:YD repeat-containing protein